MTVSYRNPTAPFARCALGASFIAAASLAAAPAAANALCAPFPQEAEALPLLYLDLPDPIASRVIEPLTADLLRAQINGEAPPPLQTLFCEVGMFEMIVRAVQPAEDDAIAAIVTEAVYAWRPDAEPAGWQLSALRRHPLCARGDDPFAPLCP